MMSLGTDFETHAYWQGYAEEPTAKELVAKNTHIIALGEAQGTHWNRIKYKERCGKPPEAVIGQATINLDSQVWKSLEDSLPKLYCVDLAVAYVMQESMRLRLMCRNKRERLIHDCPTDVHTRNLWQRAEMGKELGTESTSRIPQIFCS
jgi:hypothetical protein